MEAATEPTTENVNKPLTRTPRDVLYDNMIFYDSKARDILAQVIAGLKQSGAKPELLGMLLKEFTGCTDKAIDCATRLAPFVHGKIQNIELKGEITKRYVIRAPQQAKNSDEWLKTIDSTDNPQVMTKIPKMIVQDVDYEDSDG